MEQLMLPCISKLIFNFPCPGCGVQRALFYIFQGDLINALFMYPAIYPLIILGLLLVGQPFLKIKYYGKMLNISSIVSVGTILINYIIELIIYFQF